MTFVYNRLDAAKQDYDLAERERTEAMGRAVAGEGAVERYRAAVARVELARVTLEGWL